MRERMVGSASFTSRAEAWAPRLQQFFEHLWVRALLSTAIVVSLVPWPWVSHFDPLFFAIFAAEFVLRVFLLFQGRFPGVHASEEVPWTEDTPWSQARRRVAALSLLAVDMLALLSFLPISEAVGARWLRVFRLTRMLLLVGYWGALVRDLWSILLRRERARQVALMAAVVAGLSFAGAVLMHNLSDGRIDVDDDGTITTTDRDFVPLLWWAFRQVQDPGNMLAAPLAPAVMLISLVLTVFGLFLVSFLIGLGTDVVHELLELSRLRPSGLRGHTVIVNISPSTRQLLHELMRYTRKLFPSDAPVLSLRWFADLRRRGLGGRRYLVVGSTGDPPEFLRVPGLSEIVYRQRPPEEEDLIVRADLLAARRILLMADETDSEPDAETIRTLVTLVEKIRVKERGAPAGRKRVVIAEILDDSNIEAAHAALSTGHDRIHGFVVPTEKLLALFFASILRRPGLERVLEELLTSAGHELYTCFFRTAGLGYSISRLPDLGPDSQTALECLQALADTGMERRVIPVGLLVGARGQPGARDFSVWLNPPQTVFGPEEELRGFIALADRFGSVRELAELAAEVPCSRAAPCPGPGRMPRLGRTHRRKTTRVLVCGFRPGSIYMLEELFRSDPGGEVLVLVDDEVARQEALGALEAHSELVRRGLMHGRHGVFEPSPGGAFQVRLQGAAQAIPPSRRSMMHVCVADSMASRNLVDLPAGFGHVASLDAIVFVASDPAAADKRTTTALLKLEQLCARAPARPRVVAEVIDGKLAQRLRHRYEELGIEDVRVFSIQELRAYFLFQSVVVPGFDVVYAELLGSWGQSFVHKHVEQPGEGRCTFAALAERLRTQHEVLVAVELGATASSTRIHIAPCRHEPAAEFDLRELQGVWVVAPDSASAAGATSPPEGVQRAQRLQVH